MKLLISIHYIKTFDKTSNFIVQIRYLLTARRISDGCINRIGSDHYATSLGNQQAHYEPVCSCVWLQGGRYLPEYGRTNPLYQRKNRFFFNEGYSSDVHRACKPVYPTISSCTTVLKRNDYRIRHGLGYNMRITTNHRLGFGCIFASSRPFFLFPSE